jgi:zinc transport system ATP-binding protein
MSQIRPPNRASVAFENVTVALGGNVILDGVSARVPPGSCTAIVGPNGAGKTTMLLALLGQLSYQGRIRVTCEPEERRPRIGYVPQRLQFDRGLPITVLEFMVMGWQRNPLWFGVRKRHRGRAKQLLAAVRADGLEARRLGALSGGEMQRVLLALALGQTPDLLVLDEPAAGVDFQGEHVFCELLEGLRREQGFTQLMVSHDLATVTHHATHVICLNRKVAAEGPPGKALTNATLTAVFGPHKGLVDHRGLPEGNVCCRGPDRAGGCGHA